MQKFICYFDGACEPMNPGGNMGIGACIFNGETLDENVCFAHANYVPASPKNSNNVAEYMAFISVCEWLEKNAPAGSDVIIYGDSKLVICQMSGTWQIKFGLYVPFAKRGLSWVDLLRKTYGLNLRLQWVPRAMNSHADRLSKKKMIENGVEFRLQKQDKTEEILSEWKKDAPKDENGNSIITPSYIHARPKQ